jgi:hypothetical protein
MQSCINTSPLHVGQGTSSAFENGMTLLEEGDNKGYVSLVYLMRGKEWGLSCLVTGCSRAFQQVHKLLWRPCVTRSSATYSCPAAAVSSCQNAAAQYCKSLCLWSTMTQSRADNMNSSLIGHTTL